MMYEGRKVLARELGFPYVDLFPTLSKGSKDIVDVLSERAEFAEKKGRETIFSSGIEVVLADDLVQEGVGPLITKGANLFDHNNLRAIQKRVKVSNKPLKDFEVESDNLLLYHMQELKDSLKAIKSGFSENGDISKIYGCVERDNVLAEVYSIMEKGVDTFLSNPSLHHSFLSLFEDKSEEPLMKEAVAKAALAIAGRIKQSPKDYADAVLISAALFFDNISMITDDPVYTRQGLFHEDGMRHAQESAKYVQEILGIKDESVIAGIMNSHRYSVQGSNGHIPITRAPGVLLSSPEKYALVVNALYTCLSKDHDGRGSVEAIYKLNLLSSKGYIDTNVAEVFASMIDSPVNTGYREAFDRLNSYEKFVQNEVKKGDKGNSFAQNCCASAKRYVWSRTRGQSSPELLCDLKGCPKRGGYAGIERGIEYKVGDNQVSVPSGGFFKCSVLNGGNSKK